MLEAARKRVADLIAQINQSALIHHVLLGRKQEADEALHALENVAIAAAEDVAKAVIPGGEIIVPAIEEIIKAEIPDGNVAH